MVPDFVGFIKDQPFYFEIPLWILFFIFILFASIGAVAVFAGFCRNIEDLEKKDFFGFPEKLSFILLAFSYLAFFYIIYIQFLKIAN